MYEVARILEKKERNRIFFAAYYLMWRIKRRMMLRMMSMLWRCHRQVVSCAVSCISERDVGVHERVYVWKLGYNRKLGAK